MLQDFQAGDFLIFQLEAAFGLLRVLAVEETDGGGIWHVAVYRDLFLDSETADVAIDNAENLVIEIPHAAITNRAFESTQVAKMRSITLTEAELAPYEAWRSSTDQKVSDRSVRLLLGLR